MCQRKKTIWLVKVTTKQVVIAPHSPNGKITFGQNSYTQSGGRSYTVILYEWWGINPHLFCFLISHLISLRMPLGIIISFLPLTCWKSTTNRTKNKYNVWTFEEDEWKELLFPFVKIKTFVSLHAFRLFNVLFCMEWELSYPGNFIPFSIKVVSLCSLLLSHIITVNAVQ